ncbi:hypothetical protein AVEN_29443-1 [Araneus ventricosus]|uniref:Uncharacterized protein n=1 Tax=Araneus ventricosus TaxID=182803 RepID=A0A4Y2D0G1_ARAVE|nr:hypothetical protein AVEN_29443-1 [Araneus ventricosus]
MAIYGELKFFESLKKEPADRTADDHQIIYSYLHGLEALSSLREASLRALCKTVRYEAYEANDILYCPQLDQVQESVRPLQTIGERFMEKEVSAASVGTRPWTPEGRSLPLSIALML